MLSPRRIVIASLPFPLQRTTSETPSSNVMPLTRALILGA
jgi:hypothetical protein